MERVPLGLKAPEVMSSMSLTKGTKVWAQTPHKSRRDTRSDACMVLMGSWKQCEKRSDKHEDELV